MTMLDTGTYGAKRQSFNRVSPRDLLLSVLENNKTRDEARIFKLFRAALDEHEDRDALRYAIDEYWHANNFRSLVKPITTPAERKQREGERQSLRAEVMGGIEKKVRERAKLLLLDMVLPNGLQLRDCTGVDCKRFAPRIGNMLKKLGDKLKPAQRVGDLFKTDKALKAFYTAK